MLALQPTTNDPAARKSKRGTTFLWPCLLTLDTFPGRTFSSTTSAPPIYASIP